MALKPCAECGARISTEAEACPHCGAKPRATMGPIRRLILGLIAVSIAVSVFSPKGKDEPIEKPGPAVKTAEQIAEEAAAKARSERAIFVATALKHGLRDPDSVKWESVYVNDDASVVCVEYRAKNGFGGVNFEQTVYAKGKFSTAAKPWNSHCAGKRLNNLKPVVEHVLKRSS
ncbi:hypothetical protein [Massilia sp.]|uniref:hypothetical protein n=1 Tax=Massilia sp. TaxID=1882437 RepID=UPI00289BFA4A|nr:hypothetical protein [Massilia sp.]